MTDKEKIAKYTNILNVLRSLLNLVKIIHYGFSQLYKDDNLLSICTQSTTTMIGYSK